MKVLKEMKLKETLNPTNDGIFKRLYATHELDAFLTEDDAKTLDIEYYLSHSGEKYISRLYINLLKFNDTLEQLTKIILTNYKDNWLKVYDAYTTDYEPLENYRMVENEKVKSKVTNTVGTSADTYGFNSVDSVPTSKVNTTSTTEGSKDDNDRDLTRSGNIGVTTSQQMLESELSLRKFEFYHVLMNDIDKILCLKKY